LVLPPASVEKDMIANTAKGYLDNNKLKIKFNQYKPLRHCAIAAMEKTTV
jgi:hypothetical protein